MTYEAFKEAELLGWNARAQSYDDYTGQVTSQAIPTLLAMAETAPGKRILDLCCGTGRAAGAAAALGARAEGIDVSPAMIEAARENFPDARFDVGDAEAIPREADSYDAVICSFGLMHLASPETLFSELARVVKPGGRVALSHWIGPPDSPLFRIVFGTMQRLADMSTVPTSPPPFALSSEDALQDALGRAGFGELSATRLPLVFRSPAGKFAEHFRTFAARAAVILDQQSDAVLGQIYSAWEDQLDEYLLNEEYRVPMPALAVSAVREE